MFGATECQYIPINTNLLSPCRSTVSLWREVLQKIRIYGFLTLNLCPIDDVIKTLALSFSWKSYNNLHRLSHLKAIFKVLLTSEIASEAREFLQTNSKSNIVLFIPGINNTHSHIGRFLGQKLRIWEGFWHVNLLLGF